MQQQTTFRGKTQTGIGLRARFGHPSEPAPEPPSPGSDPVPPTAAPVAPPRPPIAALAAAPVPGSVEETGLDLTFLSDLVLKLVYFNDQITAAAICERLCLRYGNIIERALILLRREHLLETTSRGAQSELNYGYTITEKGVARVTRVLENNGYIGPAPITVEHYTNVVRHQAIADARVGPEAVREALSDLVLEELVIRSIGRAVNTGRSLFLFGEPGNGKTVLAEHVVPLLGGHVLIPHAVTVDGQVIKVYDPPNHVPIATDETTPHFDPRFVLCRRPAFIVGGELTLAALDLAFDAAAKQYQAPLQMKANGGMFLIDDFGRQLVKPRELLNRWIVPLEKRLDYLTLRTGKKIEVPFDQLIVFSTNLAPEELVDEAFLRRIQNKIKVGNPTHEAFVEIFHRQCAELGVTFDQAGLDYLLREYYVKPAREYRACHPRDLLRTMVGIARYDGSPPTMAPALIDQACETYFVDL